MAASAAGPQPRNALLAYLKSDAGKEAGPDDLKKKTLEVFQGCVGCLDEQVKDVLEGLESKEISAELKSKGIDVISYQSFVSGISGLKLNEETTKVISVSSEVLQMGAELDRDCAWDISHLSKSTQNILVRFLQEGGSNPEIYDLVAKTETREEWLELITQANLLDLPSLVSVCVKVIERDEVSIYPKGVEGEKLKYIDILKHLKGVSKFSGGVKKFRQNCEAKLIDSVYHSNHRITLEEADAILSNIETFTLPEDITSENLTLLLKRSPNVKHIRSYYMRGGYDAAAAKVFPKLKIEYAKYGEFL